MTVFVSLWLLLSGLAPAGIVPVQTGKVSFYAQKFNGRRTASGERVNAALLEAAHRTLPFNTLVEVTNLRNHRSVVVRINDRGPFSAGRVMDVTYAAAKALGVVAQGTGTVSLRVVGRGKRGNNAAIALETKPVTTPDCPNETAGKL
jgi:rare lipoprotein A